MKSLTLGKLGNYVRLAVGNDKPALCHKGKGSLVVMTTYLLMFTLGLLFGDFFVTGIIDVERFLGFIATSLVYIFGVGIIHDGWKRKEHTLASIVALILIGSQSIVMFNLFPLPLTNIFIYMGSVASIAYLYRLVNPNETITGKPNEQTTMANSS